MWAHGHFYWNELRTRDPEKAKTFYAETLGWRFDDMPMPDGVYSVAMDGDTPIGGIMKTPQPDGGAPPDQWCAYIAVDDVDARVRKATEHGAVLMRDVFDVPGIGRIALLREPWGTMIGWMTPAPPPEG